MAEVKLGQVKLADCRLSFFKGFKATASVSGGRETYKSSFLFDPSTKAGKANIKALEAAVEAVGRDKWKDKWPAIKKGIKEDRMCFRDGDTFVGSESGEIYDGYEGMMALTGANQNRFTIVDRDRTPLTEEDGKPYSGCYVNAVVRLYAVADKEKGGNGVFCTIEAVQYFRKGAAFGATAMSAEEAFDDLSDMEEEEDDDGLDEEPRSSKGGGKKGGKNTRGDDDDDDDGDDLI
jgi:hypothetical protein